MTLEQIRTFHKCCNTIIKAARGSSPNSFMQYAAGYTKEGLRMDKPKYIQSQIDYILNNTAHWHGGEARETKALLKGLQND